jgi:VCBS repeat protein
VEGLATLRKRRKSGAGLFRDPVSPFISPTVYPGGGSVASADFNRDGKPDLAVAGGIYNARIISISLNNGDGSLTQTANLSVTDAGFVFTADLNRDNKAALIGTDYNRAASGFCWAMATVHFRRRCFTRRWQIRSALSWATSTAGVRRGCK